MPIRSPYEILGVPPSATDAQLRAAYRRLVQLHHPDHNQNSPESARHFEEVQAAYLQILRERKDARPQHPQAEADPELEKRIQDLERQVRASQKRARRAAEKAARQARKRPTDEELGHYTTDDSITKILIDGLEELASKLDRHLKKER